MTVKHPDYPTLLSPWSIRGVPIRNRVVFRPWTSARPPPATGSPACTSAAASTTCEPHWPTPSHHPGRRSSKSPSHPVWQSR